MSELYLMATISDRNQSRRFLAFYKEYGISVTFLTLGRGTAASEVLDAFGLEASEKAVQFAVVTAAEWKKVKKGLEQEIKIKEKALKLKEEKKLRKICLMVVFGDTTNGEKEIYVAYMSEPSFPQFSKFMAASKKDEVIAMRTLARDCFVDGDKELVDDESLFLFGLMGQLSELITTRQSVLVNL